MARERPWRTPAIVAAAAFSSFAIASTAHASFSRYLIVWAGDADRQHDDFLVVIDVTPAPRYGQVIATVPVQGKALQPHHTEHAFSVGHPLFANGFGANRTFRFDLGDPLEPRLIGELQTSPGFTFPHSFARLPNGNVLATMQARDLDYRGPGGLVEFDDQGNVVRSASASAAGIEAAGIRPYSLAILPQRDRVISTSAIMGLPDWQEDPAGTAHEHDGRHVQLWRLSDLELLGTIELPEVPGARVHLQPAEPRLAANGEALVATMECGLYRVGGLDANTFSAEFVYDFGGANCAVPLIVANLWIQSVGSKKRIVALDVSDPSAPVEVSHLQLDEKQSPDWLALDSLASRLIVVNGPAGERRIWMATLDAKGHLALDERFRDAGSDRSGLSFDREDWPHGRTGAAIPHGSVFVDEPPRQR
jgi:hypothetical protein